jgi:small subunit ribosomal protein S20
MPNIRSSKKDVRRTEARTLRNQASKSKVKTLRKRVLAALTSGDATAAQNAYNAFASAADKASKSNAIHKNKASRLKSRVAAKLAKKA